MPFIFEKTDLDGLVLVKPKIFADERGFFLETYKKSEFEKAGIKEDFVQDNHSKSSKGVLRGLHYQQGEHAQGKLVRCLRGEIFDVVIDMRPGSPTCRQWLGFNLVAENSWLLYIPPGFAHGFQVLTDTAEIMYKCTKEYSPAHECGIIWNDPSLKIDWPLKPPILSAKDQASPLLGARPT